MKYITRINTLFVKSWTAFVLLSSFLLAGCNGHTDEDTGTVVGDKAQIDISIADANGNETNSITVGNQLTVSVIISDVAGTPLANQNVGFSAPTGALSASSKLTSSNGTASITFDSTDVAAGVVAISATTTYQGETLTAAVEFEVLATAVVDVESPQLTITLKKDGIATNRIKAGESGQLGAQLLDANGDPIVDKIVTFSAEIGILSANTALTNSNGIAEVSLTGDENNLGAAIATASVSVNDINYAQTTPYEVVAADALDESTAVLIGHFDADGNFVDGEIGVDVDTISAGATAGLSVVLVDQDLNRITSPTTVNFNSSCALANKAVVDSSVITSNGEAFATYQDINCAGPNGNTDTIVATVVVNSADLTATRDLTLQSEALGSIEFVSASPESIVLKGTGGQGKQETSTVTFLVKGELGNPSPQQQVNFSLNTDAGGLTLASFVGTTNSEGLVSAKVIAGTVPTAVRVRASITVDTTTVSTQSDLLSVNTGLPDQNSITLSLDTLNPEARSHVGTTVQVTAYLADSFNNPVPDGTTVNFTTEGGAIEPSCTTTNGNCAVTWTSQQPFADDHRVTILATAEGHEYFVDVNGNNIYDDSDGGSVNSSTTNINEILSGFGRISAFNGGFIDMPEAWRDDNENDLYDSGEVFIDSNNNQTRDSENGLFNGPQCSGSNCATSKFITIRKAALLITSSSSALYRLVDTATGDVIISNYDNTAIGGTIDIPRGTGRSFRLEMSDTEFQILPKETSIDISSSVGELVGGGSFLIPNSTGSSDPAIPGTSSFSFTIINTLGADDDPVIGGLEFSATTPRNISTGGSIVVNLL